VLETASKGSVEYEYAMNLVPLPVDHRYDASDMEVIASAVIDYKGKEGLQ